MVTLTITRGLPGSGKTTASRQVSPGTVRVSKDDLNQMIGNRHLANESVEFIIRYWLRRRHDVIYDSTNLPESAVERWRKVAEEEFAEFEIIDLTDVPLDECIRRAEERSNTPRYFGSKITADYITRIWHKYLK